VHLVPETPSTPLDAASRFNESQRRSLSVGLHHIAGLLDEVEHILQEAARRSPFRRLASDISPSQAGVIRDYLERVGEGLLAAARRHGLDIAGPALDARRSLEATLIAASIGVEEMRPRRLRGYGVLAEETAQELARTCDELARAIREVLVLVARGAEEDYEARLARLGETSGDPKLLTTLERVIRDHGLVELRPLLRSVLERLEERSFHVAVFGRVSSGKSSLLNALLGLDLLPVGVTPVTAVPTRVRVGSPPSVRIQITTGASESMGIEALAELASEESNPGNVRRVSRLEVVYPVADLPEGVVLVDTPGIGSLASAGATEAIAYLPRADLALLLVDVGSWLGRDDLALLRLFREAAIPVEVLVSKADLVSASELEKLVGQVAAAIEREVALKPKVTPVSSIGPEHPLVQAWARDRLRPRFERRRELAAESVHRLTGRLLEQVITTLRSRAGRDPSERTDPQAAVERARAADARIAVARQALGRQAEQGQELLQSVLRASAAAALSEWREGEPRRLDSASLVSAALDEAAASERLRALSILSTLHGELLAAAGEIDPVAAELFATRLPGPDLAGLPVLDGSAALPLGPTVGRPLLAAAWPGWAARRVARTLDLQLGSALRSLLRSHGHRLREFTDRAVSRLAEAFHAAVGPFVAPADSLGSGSPSDPADRRRLEADLAELRALQNADGGIPT
jgi:GTP-binding protein EngB required for normal cell division